MYYQLMPLSYHFLLGKRLGWSLVWWLGYSSPRQGAQGAAFWCVWYDFWYAIGM